MRGPRDLRLSKPEGGSALLLTFLMMLVLAGLATAGAVFSHNSLMTGKAYLLDQHALYVAEAGQQRARQALIAGTWTAAASPGNTYSESFGPGAYSVTIVDNGGATYTITSSGYVPNATTYAARRQIAEGELSVTVSDGTNASLTATASASSEDASNPASNAKDGSTSTSWKAGSNGSGWLAMDYGSAVTLNKIVVKEDNNITGVSIEWSDDGSSWTTASGLSVSASGKTWTSTFISASHRYFRASLSASSGKKPSVKEMESYNSTLSALGAGEVTTQW